MTHHLGYEKHSPEGKNSGNSRNGKSRKTLKGKQGEIPIEVPRDRNGEFDPQFVKKRQTRFDGFDDKIISLYARGMTASEIQGVLSAEWRRHSFFMADAILPKGHGFLQKGNNRLPCLALLLPLFLQQQAGNNFP